MSPQDLQRYQQLLEQDPHSRVFAPLADAYREQGRLDEAEAICTQGLIANPEYASGHLAMGRIRQAQGQHHEALHHYTEAVKLSPDNLLAYQLLGDTFIALKQAKEALKAYKMALFIDPKLEKAQKAVKKLESLTADEYEDEVFEMKNISSPPKNSEATWPQSIPSKMTPVEKNSAAPTMELDREVSYIDALLVRGNIVAAEERLHKVMPLFPANEELLRRYQLIKPTELPTPLKPAIKRERVAWEQKRQSLERVQKAIGHRQALIAEQHFTESIE